MNFFSVLLTNIDALGIHNCLLISHLPISQKMSKNSIKTSAIKTKKMVRLTDPPFRLLLYLEWLVLATAALLEVLLPFQLSWLLALRILAIALFGLIGLRLPTTHQVPKLLYTALEFGLLMLIATQNTFSTRSVFLLGLVIVMRSCLIFERGGQLTVLSLVLISYGTFLLSRPVLLTRDIATVWDWRLSNAFLFSLTLIFALLLINALLAERQSRAQLEMVHEELGRTHQQLRHYALRIEDQATLQERNRIAREIHDGLGHTLAAQTIQINNALLYWQSDPEKLLLFLNQAKQLGAEAMLEIRRSLLVLRSTPLQGQSLEIAIHKLMTEFHQNTQIEPSYQVILARNLTTEVNTTLYRILQEALTNIYKHAQASEVVVQLKENSEMLQLSIHDNGQGFNPMQNTTGFGLKGLRERAAALGGQLRISSQPGKGCSIDVLLPLSNVLI